MRARSLATPRGPLAPWRRGVASVTLATTLAMPAAALAQDDPREADYARAAQLRSAEPERALTLYRELYAQTRSPRALAQQGVLEAQLGRWLAAEEHLVAALAAPSDPWVTTRRDALTANLAQVRAHLSDLVVVVTAPGAALRVNGGEAVALPRAEGVRVAVGQVVIDLDAPGFEHVRQPVLVTPGRTRVEVTMVSASPVVTAPPPPPPPPPPTPPPPVVTPRAAGSVPVGGVVVAGAGVASFVLAGVFAGLASSAREGCAYVSSTDTLRCPTMELTTQARRGQDYTLAANVALGVGAAAVVGGGVWIALSMLSPRARGAERARLTAAPQLVAGAPGVSVAGTF